MKRPKDWWKQFDGMIGELLFDAPLAWAPKPSDTKKEVLHILKRLQLKKSATILDLACGVGRHSLLLAQRGFNVVGLDYSKIYLTRARKEAKRLGVHNRVKFVHADMRTVGKQFAPESFDAVVCLWNSFGYFNKRSDDRKVVRGVSRILKPDGHFVLSTFHKAGLVYQYGEHPQLVGQDAVYRWVKFRPGYYLLTRNHINTQRNTFAGEWIVMHESKGKLWQMTHEDNLYDTSELVSMLSDQGLKKQAVFGSRFGDRLTKRSSIQQIFARKM